MQSDCDFGMIFSLSKVEIAMLRRHLTILVLIFPLILLSQSIDPFEKNVSYTSYQKPLSEVLVDLSRISQINIAFDPSIISEEYIVSINVKDESLDDILEVILDETNLQYKHVEGQIIISVNEDVDEKGRYIITGFLEDATSRERLFFATVYSYTDQIGTTTNEYGYFSISSKDSIANIGFSYLGYEPIILDLASGETQFVSLQPNIRLNEILIEDYRLPSEDPIENMNTFPLTTLKTMTSLGGDPDVIRLAGMQAGVSSGADGIGGLNVRGGSADQNLVLLDGVPVYNTGHTLGMFSIFNSSMIRSSTLIKDAFPAKYGGRLSSVLDIRTKEGNLKEYSGEFSLGTIAAKAMIEGPLVKDKAGFILAFRKSFVNTWLKTISSGLKEASGNAGELAYDFYDINAKVHFKIGKTGTLAFSYYEGRDLFADETIAPSKKDSLDFEEHFNTQWTWGNRIATMRMSSSLSDKLHFNGTLYYSNFKFDAFKNDQVNISTDQRPISFSYLASLFQTGIVDIGGRLDFDYNLSNKHNLKFGFDGVQHRFIPGLVVSNQADSLIRFGEVVEKETLEGLLDLVDESGLEANVYLEDQIRANDYFEIIGGVRGSLIRSRGQNYYSLLPTVTLNFTPTPNALLKLSYSKTTQYLHLLTTSGLGLPTDIWLPTTDRLRPQLGTQYTAGLIVRERQIGYFEFGGFYKNLNRVLALSEGPIFDINQTNDWDLDIPEGVGFSYGFEFTAVKNIGRLKGLASYTYSKSERQFEEINNGEAFPFRYDRRHMFNSSMSYRINKNIELTGNGIYQKGNWVTIPTSIVSLGEGTNEFLYVYTKKNNLQLQDYKRIDLAVNIYNKYDWGSQRISIGLYNVFNWENPLLYFFRRDEEDGGRPQGKQISVLTILPSISYSLSF